MLETGKAQRCVAADLSAPSLEKAQRLLAGRSDVEFRCGDGLHVLGPGEADVICVCGMGGHQIIRILSEGRDVAMRAQFLVLGPHRNAPELRSYLRTHCYAVVRELVVEERGHFYELMLVRSGQDGCADAFWNDVACADKSDSAYIRYLQHMLRTVTQIIHKLEHTGKDEERLCALRTRAERLKEELR